jgi:simple sugar transport system permease protein
MKFWNLGGNGQILMGALVTVAIMRGTLGQNVTIVANILMVLCAILIGMVWAVIPAIFKAFFKTNESLFTLMMNYIAVGLVSYYINKWSTNGSGVLGQIKTGHLPEILNPHLLTIIVVAILTAVMHVYMKHSKQGYEIAVVGESENTAKYIGVNVKKVIIRTLAISGAICGIIGLLLAGSIDHSISEQTANNMGFTAIMVAWLAKFNPLIMILSSLLIAFLTRGMSQVQTDFGITNDAVSDIVVGIIYFVVIGCEFFIRYQLKFKKEKTAKKSNDFLSTDSVKEKEEK